MFTLRNQNVTSQMLIIPNNNNIFLIRNIFFENSEDLSADSFPKNVQRIFKSNKYQTWF